MADNPNNIIIDASVATKWCLLDEIDSETTSLRIDREKATEFYSAFLDLTLIVYNSPNLMKQSLDKALQLDISAYDASYLVLAEYLEIPFYTADQKLLSKSNSPLIKPLSAYPSWN